MKKVILTTGGTGGHIYPALAVAEGLKSKGIETLFIGSNTRMEKEIVPKAQFRFIGLNIDPPRTIKSVIKYIKSFGHAYRILKQEDPDAVVGFGNYISVPVLAMSFLLRKKIYLQEQNADLGFANRLFYRFAQFTFLAFEYTYNTVPIKYQKKFIVSGNPLRSEIQEVSYDEARERLKVQHEEKVLLITGGSLGAQEINNAVLKYWEHFFQMKHLRVYWATGKQNYEEVQEKVKRAKMTDTIKDYFENMIHIMAASDLVVCRAGALTISELIALQKPAVIIPYSSQKVGQYQNAKILEERHSAVVYTNQESERAIEKVIELLSNEEELRTMGIRMRSLQTPNAVNTIISNLDIWRD
ncbi:undecaprenyldiphospho-muramoylpentapeptide beta-N-acetylglucosaminyltransferase [Fusobacterium necrophorum]|uniref:undecaprenyldiphospho-muramoylpentapeptide beta-N-acetylglucosaminyltransferase n=1 Tax=Fusobacterium necrophorum TaxID=859 RepID=UPI00370F5BE4